MIRTSQVLGVLVGASLLILFAAACLFLAAQLVRAAL